MGASGTVLNVRSALVKGYWIVPSWNLFGLKMAFCEQVLIWWIRGTGIVAIVASVGRDEESKDSEVTWDLYRDAQERKIQHVKCGP